MGYRSQIALKTTTEGWILLKRFNDKIENPDERPLRNLTVGKTPTGYYKISHGYIKWYDGDPQVQNFNEALHQMRIQNIPYVFIEIGEDIEDITIQNSWTSDMPDEIETFDIKRRIADADEGCYEIIMEDGVDKKYRDLFTPPEERSDSDDTHLTSD